MFRVRRHPNATEVWGPVSGYPEHGRRWRHLGFCLDVQRYRRTVRIAGRHRDHALTLAAALAVDVHARLPGVRDLGYRQHHGADGTAEVWWERQAEDRVFVAAMRAEEDALVEEWRERAAGAARYEFAQ